MGKAPLGGGAYTDQVFILTYGWKLRPVDYTEDQVIVVTGTLITDDNSPRTVSVIGEGCPTWEFQVATSGVVTQINSGSGLSQEKNYTLAFVAINTELIFKRTQTSKLDVLIK